MTRDELKRYRRPAPLSFPISARETEVSDDHGVYSTGFFEYKGKSIIISIDGGLWHLSASANHTLGYYEIKELRYKFMPNGMNVAQIFPPREDFVNLHPNCFHLWEIKN